MNDIYHDVFIKAPKEKVFAYFTQAEHLINWWPETCYGTPRKNAQYNFTFGPKYNWFGKVTKCRRNSFFYIKMTQSDKDWDSTTFGFSLSTVKDGTQLKFSHTGWQTNNHHFRRSSYSWAILLNGLKDYVENGKIVPFRNRNNEKA